MNYDIELSPLNQINPLDIKLKTTINSLKITSEQIYSLSAKIVNEIVKASEKGLSEIEIEVSAFKPEVRKVVIKQLKQHWKARIYSLNVDAYLYETYLKVKW